MKESRVYRITTETLAYFGFTRETAFTSRNHATDELKAAITEKFSTPEGKNNFNKFMEELHIILDQEENGGETTTNHGL
jgi:hypothetical protein